MQRNLQANIVRLMALAALIAPVPAVAGGLYLPGVGPVAQARAGAFVANAGDGSALYYNPAGFAKHQGTTVLLGANFIDMSLRYQRAGAYENVPGQELPYAGQPFAAVEDASSPAVGIGGFQALPLLVVSTDLGLEIPGLRFGGGFFVPNGFPERDFGSDYTFEEEGVPPPPQRYDVVSQDASTIVPSVAVGYRVHDTLDIGARASWGIAGMKATTYTWGLANHEEWVARDGEFRIDVSDNFVPSFGIGILYRPADAIEVGAAYNSKMIIDGKGTGVATLGSDLTIGGQLIPSPDPRCASGGTPEALKVCATIPLARTATVGGRYIVRDARGAERGDVELDVRWEDWSSASDFDIVVDASSSLLGPLSKTVVRHNLHDSVSFRLGGSWAFAVGEHRLIARGGAAYDTAAADESWTRLDFDSAARTTLALGAGYELGRFRVDVGGGVVLESDRRVALCNRGEADPGCDGSAQPPPVSERTQPDPVQPIQGPAAQAQSPFNGGEYSSGYVLLSLGLSAQF